MAATIRLATNQDIPGVVAVIRSVYDEYGFPWEEDGYHRDLYDLDLHYRDQGDRFFVAEVDGEIAGTAALEFHSEITGETGTLVQVDGYWRIAGIDCSLERLYVPSNRRKMGIGRRLSETVIQEARERDCRQMEIWSDKKFSEAHVLYQKLGAVVVGERLCDDPDQSPEWGLILEL
jgi:putative acetyltransferase